MVSDMSTGWESVAGSTNDASFMDQGIRDFEDKMVSKA